MPQELRQRPLEIKIAAYLADRFGRERGALGLTRGEFLEVLMELRDAHRP